MFTFQKTKCLSLISLFRYLWDCKQNHPTPLTRRGRTTSSTSSYTYLRCTCALPFQINIDSSTRETIIRNIQEPTETCFEEAQKIVYMHMERDSYPRFLKSEMYQKLLKTIQPDNSWPLLNSLHWKWCIENTGFVLLIKKNKIRNIVGMK